MSFAEALANHGKSSDQVADLAPSHLVLVDAWVAYCGELPRSPLHTFLGRVIEVLQSPRARTRSLDLAFMDLRSEDLGMLERILSLPGLRFLDIRRGNFRLHTEAVLRMIHEVTLRPSSTVAVVFIYPCDLPNYLRDSPRLRSVASEVHFEALIDREPPAAEVPMPRVRPLSPLTRKTAKPMPNQPVAQRMNPKNMDEALEVFKFHRLTPAQMFESPPSLDALINNLRKEHNEQWQDIIDASRIIHQALPLSVVIWAQQRLGEFGLQHATYNKDKIDSVSQSVSDKEKREMLDRCIGVMRRHVGMVLRDIGFNEAEAQVKLDSLRKKVESYKSARRYDDAEQLEEVMDLVVDWRAEFGYGCKEAEEPKVDYQMVRRVR